jgi:hypothetical protein
MEIKGLFESLAEYLDFVVDFLMLSGMEKYAHLSTINPKLVLYLVTGVFLAYLISSMRTVPTYMARGAEAQPNPFQPYQLSFVSTGFRSQSETETKKFDVNMAQFVIMTILGAVLFHCFLILYSRIFGTPEIRSIKDSLNGIFAYNSVYYPFHALMLVVRRGANAMSKWGPVGLIYAGVLEITVGVALLGSLIYLLFALASVHQLSIASLVLPSLAFFLVLTTLFVGFFAAAGLPLKMIGTAVINANSEQQMQR